MIKDIILAAVAVACIKIADLTGKYVKHIVIITVSLVLITGCISDNDTCVRILRIVIINSLFEILKTIILHRKK